MATIKMPRILYFIEGAVPSPKDFVESMKYGTNVVFRDATKIGEEMLEACDGCAGAIPAKYHAAIADAKIAMQHADDVMRKFMHDGKAMFAHGATVTGGELAQLHTSITAEVRGSLAADYDKALGVVNETHATIQAALEGELAAARTQIATLEAQLAAALKPADPAPAGQIGATGNEAPAGTPIASNAGWTANVDPVKPA